MTQRIAAERPRLHGSLQHLTLATQDPATLEAFYFGKLGFDISDRVRNDKGEVNICWMRSNHEHHALAFFRSRHPGIDHHSYEAGEWTKIRDWTDHFATRNIRLIWGPGPPWTRQQPGCFHRRYRWQSDRSFRRARGRSRPTYQGLAPRRKDPEPLGSRDHAQLVSHCT